MIARLRFGLASEESAASSSSSVISGVCDATPTCLDACLRAEKQAAQDAKLSNAKHGEVKRTRDSSERCTYLFVSTISVFYSVRCLASDKRNVLSFFFHFPFTFFLSFFSQDEPFLPEQQLHESHLALQRRG